MSSKLCFILSTLLLSTMVFAGSYEVPIQTGVRNTINFDVSTLGQGASGLNSLISGGSSNNNDYTYSFSGLPNWMNNIGGASLSGVPPSGT
jgi:hypothetical protein